MSTSYYRPDDPALVFIQSRAETDPDLVEEYAEMMAGGTGFDPVEAVTDGSKIYVWDGFHRGEAAKKSDTLLFVRSRPGTLEEAQWLALGANQKHGRRRSNADKQKIVKLALLHPAGVKLSDRQIAQHCGVTGKTVARIRREMELTAEIPQSDTRIGADGREINTARIGTTRPETTGKLLQSDTRIGADGREINTARIGTTRPEYLAVWELEQQLGRWLACRGATDHTGILEAIKRRTDDGRALFNTFCDSIDGPHRTGDAWQACNNVLEQFQQRLNPKALPKGEHPNPSTKSYWDLIKDGGQACYLCGKPAKWSHETGYWLCNHDYWKYYRQVSGESSLKLFTANMEKLKAEYVPEPLETRYCRHCGAPREFDQRELKTWPQTTCDSCGKPAFVNRWLKEPSLSNTPLIDTVMALPEEELELAINDEATYEAMYDELIEAGLDGDNESAGEITGDPGQWDFTNVTTAEIERDLANLEHDGLPQDSPFAGRLREELALRRRLEVAEGAQASGGQEPAIKASSADGADNLRISLIQRVNRLINRWPDRKLAKFETWLAETERQLEIWRNLERALDPGEDSQARWNEHRQTGLSDAVLRRVISSAFHGDPAFSGPDDPGARCKGGKNPAFWLGHIGSYGRKPTLQGKALLDTVRELMEIPQPAEEKVLA